MAAAGICDVHLQNYTTWLWKVPSPGMMTMMLTSIVINHDHNAEHNCQSAQSANIRLCSKPFHTFIYLPWQQPCELDTILPHFTNEETEARGG